MIRLLLAIALVCSSITAAETEAKLPTPAQTALDRLAKADAKLAADYRKALAVERSKAMAELEKVQKATTKAGDLDGALAVKAKLDELRAAQEAEAGDLLGGDRPAVPADLSKQVVGRWNLTKANGASGTAEFTAGGMAVVSLGPFTIGGRWRIEKDRVLVTWANDESKLENLAFDGPDRLAGDSFDAGKNGITCTRIKAAAK